MYACKIPGVFKLGRKCSKGRGDHVDRRRTCLGWYHCRLEKHSSNSLATEAALLHIKTNSTSFVNATLFSQSTLKEANSTVMLIKSNSNAEGTLLKLTASGKSIPNVVH